MESTDKKDTEPIPNTGTKSQEVTPPPIPQYLEKVENPQYLEDGVWSIKVGDNHLAVSSYKELTRYHKKNEINHDAHHIIPKEVLAKLETNYNDATAPAIGLHREFHRGKDSLSSHITREVGGRDVENNMTPAQIAGILYSTYEEGNLRELNQIVSNVTRVDQIPQNDQEWDKFETRVYNEYMEKKYAAPAKEVSPQTEKREVEAAFIEQATETVIEMKKKDEEDKKKSKEKEDDSSETKGDTPEVKEAKATEEAKAVQEAKTAEGAKVAQEAKAAEEVKALQKVKAAEEAKAVREAKAAQEAKAIEEAKEDPPDNSETTKKLDIMGGKRKRLFG